MRKRNVEILYRLCETPAHRLRLQTLLDDYHISEKTLRSDILAIANYVHAPDGGSIIELTSHHVQIAWETDIEGVLELLGGMDLYDYVLSPDERVYLMVVDLLMLGEGQWLSAQSLADEMFVARNTIISDSKSVEAYLGDHGITMESKGRYGIRAQTSHLSRNEVLVDIFSGLILDMRSSESFFVRLLSCRLSYDIGLGAVVGRMQEFLKVRNSLVSPGARSVMAACLFVMLNDWAAACGRRGQGRATARPVSSEAHPTLDLLGELIGHVAQGVGLDVPGVDLINEIERLVLSRSLELQIRRIEDFDLYCAVTHFLLLVGRDLNAGIQNDGLLVESLISHVKGFSDWSSDDFDIGSGNQDNVMMEMVKTAAQPHFRVLEHFLHRRLDQSMRASLTIHICAALYRAESGQRMCKVQVVSLNPGATGKYLAAQIRRYFNLDVVESSLAGVSSGGVGQGPEAVDFVISTIPLPKDDVPVAVVSPVLSVEDINTIQALAFRCSRADESATPVSPSILTKVAALYAQGSKRKVAYVDRVLRGVLDELERVERQTQESSPLLTLLQRRYVRVEDGPLKWRDAIRLAARRLVREGYVLPSYVDKAISNVEEYGSYIVINQGVALAHAGCRDGVLRDGIGLLVCREGIRFDDIDDSVNLLFFFAQQRDGDAYLGLFREVIRLGHDRHELANVRFSETDEEAYQRIIEMLTDYEG